MRFHPSSPAFATCLLGCLLLAAGCSTRQASGPAPSDRAGIEQADVDILDLRERRALDEVLDALAAYEVVLVGERHDRFGDHLAQLAVIRGLAERWPDMAVGVEFIQQPFQDALDDYVAGRIDEAEMLRRTEWFDRWRYDYRLYRPIFRFAREHRIALVALNLPAEIVRKVGSEGAEALDPEQARWLPSDRAPADPAYRERLRRIFDQHPSTRSGDFERFVEVQLLWDEAMAERAAEHLREHSGRRMVILAGTGHVGHRSAIPDRIERRLPVDTAVITSQPPPDGDLRELDFVVLPPEAELPAPGRLGIFMENAEAGGVRVTRVLEDSAAEEAGILAGDRITALGGERLSDTADLRIAMIDLPPGERVRVTLERTEGDNARVLDYRLELGGG